MGAYSYIALNEKGRKVKGVLEGDSERQIRSQLKEKKLSPISVATAAGKAEKTLGSSWQSSKARINQRELALFTRQLATLIQSGMPLTESLQAVANQARKGKLKGLLLDVRAKVTEGHTLAYSLGEFPYAFDELYRSTVSAGEHAGYLGQVLERLADYTEARQYSQQKVRMAMLYPMILVGVAMTVIGALMTFVVPELIRIFTHADAELPLLTRILIASSDYLADYGLVTLLGLLLILVGFKTLLKNDVWRARWHRFLLHVPLVGTLIRNVETARFASTLSILMASSVPLLESLRIAGAVMINMTLKKATQQVALRVEEGSSLNRSLDQTGQFPAMMVHMIASGEVSGTLEQMLARAAENQEREQEMALQTMLAALEPLLIVFMGGFVLLIVLAVLLPIFGMNELIR